MSARCLPAVLLLALAGCGAKPTPVQWDELDYDALRDDMARPTGEVNDAHAREVVDRFAASGPTIARLAQTLERLLPAGVAPLDLPDPGGAPLSPGDPDALTTRPKEQVPSLASDGLEGTNVYAELACWGPDPAPDLSFLHGSIRVDGPSLRRETVEALAVHGHLLVSMAACQFPRGDLEGESPAYYDVDDGPALAADLDIRVREGAVEVDHIDERVLARDGVLSALYELEDGSGTLRVDFTAALTTFTITGANGTYLCQNNAEEPACALVP
ncbi:MAG: hypothetical protein R3A51_15965 [Nannocystaceae bacterium]